MHADFFDRCFRSEAVFLPENVDRAVFHELIGPADTDDGSFDPHIIEMLDNRASKTVVEHVIFDRADDFHATCEELNRACIERLDPTRIDDRRGNAFRFEDLRRLFSHLAHPAESENGSAHWLSGAVLHDFGLANLEQTRLSLWLRASANASWVPDCDRT